LLHFDNLEIEKYSSGDVPKDSRCYSFKMESKNPFAKEATPRCYWENTSKEELVLEHVQEYNR